MPYSVSVALCTYNGERYVDEQVRSILSQSRLPDEVVVADDGSTDQTLAIIRVAFEGSSVRLVVLEPEESPLGVTANFERAVRACSGDLIALCDQDDVWHFDRLDRALREFDQSPRLLLQHSDARLTDADGRPLGVTLFEGLSISPAELELIGHGRAFDAYLRRNLATGATVVFRRSLLEAALPFPREWVHDEWLAIMAAAIGTTQALEAQLIDYRQHGSNQIGVQKPTLRYKIGRMLEPRADRYQRLAERSAVLRSRLEALSAAGAGARAGAGASSVDERVLRLARQKASFEAARAHYPRARLLRLGPVLRQWRRGSYRVLSSQGDLDIARDVLQPA
ncbi:glycosyltransferase family 2 protein [Ruicaihuangia caeni]|uniref:Glycosyltransferase family 2 protein n=1 Tax=Ruicaihuangia caeni TaxID=3042517 RepID=A0AAW6TDE5_9MICO|nr:glycosyltransferase family 2 protein [Klugiella sp. YN-L-19]MDI2099420.1 glycosyltransferase family 2 protein [Klugiella sp. YN-L-19]